MSFEKQLDAVHLKFEGRTKVVEAQLQFLQAEVHSLDRIADDLKEKGLVSGEDLRDRPMQAQRPETAEQLLSDRHLAAELNRRFDALITDLNNMTALQASH